MYFSEASLKNVTAAEVRKFIKNLPSETARKDFLKENLRMRKKGLGFDWVDISWSRDYSDFSVKQLTERLIEVIKLEGTKGKEIPKHPPCHDAFARRSSCVWYKDERC